MDRVQIRPEMLRWARDRARKSADHLGTKFPKLREWEEGAVQPTFKQLEAFAKATHAPVGYLFLSEPPIEPLPIPDFRTVEGRAITSPTPDLLETIYICQDRQHWYREFKRETDEGPLQFVGSVSLNSPVEETATTIRNVLGFDLDARRACPTWTDALRLFISQADAAGVMVMCSGVVANNNRRPLDPNEFRGFALTDEIAPLVFINGGDTKAAQMFTLAHELAHVWLGRSALSDATVEPTWANEVEAWCNRVAAELLAPAEVVQAEVRGNETAEQLASRLARRFKTSTLVILRRLLDIGWFNREQFQSAYSAELERLAALPKPSGGGDFYLTTAARVSKRFARAVVESTLEGRTLYSDAFKLLGVAKTETFNELGRSLHFEV